MNVVTARDARDAGSAAAGIIARRLRRAVRTEGAATVAFSGGQTPAPMFAALAATDLPWECIEVFQVDERIAPDGDPARNANMLLEHLPMANVRVMPVTAKDLRRASARYAALLPDAFTVVHLGIGDDGHTASWPPGDPVIDSDKAVDLSAEYQDRRRMTLTPGVVNAARARVFLITEPSKGPVVEKWLGGDRALPVARVRRAGTHVVLSGIALP